MKISPLDRKLTHVSYRAVKGFWPMQLAELADGPAGSGNVERSGCSLAWNFSVTRSIVLMEAARSARQNTTLSLHQ